MSKEESKGTLGTQGHPLGAHQGWLSEAMNILRTRLKSVRADTSVAGDGTVLTLHLQGCEDDLEARRLLAENLARFLPPALSVIGVQLHPGQADESGADAPGA